MPEVWYPKARRNPGAAAGYTRGRNRMNTVKCHYTAGFDSDDLIRRDGLAQWLVTRNGEVIQYAEADALTHDSGEWNDDGPGIEVEYRDEDTIFTPAAYAATAELCQWIHDEWGVPLDFYDGPRIAEGSFSGFITHRSLVQSQPHSDYWPDLPRLAPAHAPTQEQPMFFISDGTRNAAVTEYSFFQVGPLNGLGFASVDAGTFNEIKRLTDEKRKTLTA